MSDALSLLRDCTINGNVATLEGDTIVIGEHALPKKTETNYKSGKGNMFTLDTVWFYLQNHKLAFGKYARACLNGGHKVVAIKEQKALFRYMTGKTDSSPHVQSTGEGPDATESAAATMDVYETPDASLKKDVKDWTILEIFHQEKAFRTRSDVTQHSGGKEMKGTLKIFEDACEKRKRKPEELKKTVITKKPKRLTPAMPVNKAAARKPDSVVPIILVPQQATAVINMWNVLDLLGDKNFLKAGDKIKAGGAKPTTHHLERASYQDPKRKCKFQIIDNIHKVGKDDWHRVVAVIASGVEWQLKGWPWKTPAEIFENVCSFYMHYDDEPIHKNITTWKVNRLPISKIKRYRDTSVVLEFWSILSHFIATKNSQRQLHF